MIELQALTMNKAAYATRGGGQLISTKFHAPTPRRKHVSRPALIAHLEELTSRKLTLLCAPAGFGKTTLLSEWASATEIQTAWLDLEEQDNQVERFWIYVITALQNVLEEVGETALNLLLARDYPSIEAVMTSLINDIALLPNHFALVLDDYHLIHEPDIHAAVSFLLDHLPPQLHLLIGSRAIPPALGGSASRIRTGNGTLCERFAFYFGRNRDTVQPVEQFRSAIRHPKRIGSTN